MQNNKRGFTLAEMMVVMLVLSLVTAAFLPVITRRSKTASNESIWQWVNGLANTDAYFGAGTNRSAIIGASVTDSTASKLIINSEVDNISDFPQVAFKQKNALTGYLAVSDTKILLGSKGVSPVAKFARGTVAIGSYVSAPIAGDIAIGDWAMNRANDSVIPADPNGVYPATTQGGNVAIGHAALRNISGGDRNIAIGPAAANTAVAKYDNIAIGAMSGLTYTGNSNIAIGLSAQSVGGGTNGSLDPNDTSNFVSDTISIGRGSRSSKDFAITMGLNASSAGTSSISMGANSKASGVNSIAIGSADSVDNQTKAEEPYSIAIGYMSNTPLRTNLGESFGYGISIGYKQSAKYGDIRIGSNLDTVDTYEYGDIYTNIAIGTGALKNQIAINDGYTYTGNIGIGYAALFNQTAGDSNIALGTKALLKNTTGDSNIALGTFALKRLTTGNYNTAVGTSACSGVTTGEYNTCIGYQSQAAEGIKYSTSIGYQANATADNQVVIGRTTNERIDLYGDVYVHGAMYVEDSLTTRASQYGAGSTFRYIIIKKSGGTALGDNGEAYGQVVNTPSGLNAPEPSDRRLKNVGKDFASGLDKISRLKVFNYTFKDDKEKTPRVGVIAQDLQKVFPDAVSKDEKGYLLIRKEDMFYAAINAIKELDVMVQNIKQEIKELIVKIQSLDDKILALIKVDQIHSAKIKELESKNKRLEKQNKEFETRLNKLEKMVNKK